MIRLLLILALSVTTLVFVTASSPYLMQKIEKHIGNLAYRYGDLYRLCNLRRFKINVPKYEPIPAQDTLLNNINLYLYGDSFSKYFIHADFGTQSYVTKRWNKGTFRVQIDTAKYNVLLIESIERRIKERLAVTDPPVIASSHVPKANEPLSDSTKDKKDQKAIFVFNNEQSLANLCFENDFTHELILLFRESKASMQEFLLKKISTQTPIAPDGKYLYCDEEYDPKSPYSSYFPHTDSTIDTLINNLNSWNKQWKEQGFDTIIFALIPNKCTVRETQRTDYNHLIERIEKHKNNEQMFVSIYDAFLRVNPHTPLYYQSDTHWNAQGRQIWLRSIREKLIDIAQQAHKPK